MILPMLYRRFSWLAILCAATLQAAEPTILPKPGSNDLVGVIHVDEPSGWSALLIVGGQFRPVQVTQLEGDDENGYKTCVVAGPAGSYAVIQNTGKQTKIHTLPLGYGPVPPNPPVPPSPPPNPPDPPNPPVVAGPRTILILHETGQQTPNHGILFNSLRSGPAASYLKEHKHRLFILDDDSVSSDGKPLLEAWRKHLSDITIPALVVIDHASGAVLFKGAVPETADEILSTLKAHGG